MPDFFLRSAEPEGGPDKPAGEQTSPQTSPIVTIEPTAPATGLASANAPLPESSPAAPGDTVLVYTPDLPAGPDALGNGTMLAGVAELLAHRRTTPPLTIGIFGGRGAGKSFALEQLLDRVKLLAAAAAGLGTKSPFLSRIVTVRVEAVRTTGDPATAIAAEIFRALNGGDAGGEPYAALAQEAAHAVRDPHVVAREANERLTEARHRLHAERQVLHDLDGRRAKLVETVLYELAGSNVDTYARVNRSRIEARLRAFGFTHGDPLATYRDLVRDVAEADGVSGRIATFLKALWTYRGQARLLVAALILLVLAWGCGRAGATQGVWLPWLHGTGEFGATIANWIEANLGWLAAIGGTATLAACLAVIACAWRALRFTQPIFRGASLLKLDLETRRRDLDGLIANQTRHVDTIAMEADAHARRTEEAERRARAADEGATRPAAPLVNSPFEPAPDDIDQRARLAVAFTASLAAAIARDAGNAFNVPQRILVAIDDLDALPPARAASFIETAHRLLSAKSFVVLLAADPSRLAAAWGEADRANYLDKYVQVPLHVTAGEPGLYGGLVHSLIGRETTEKAQWPELDAKRSALDLPWRSGEADLLSALAPLAGHSPRSIKRFVNIYRLVRLRADGYAPLALLLALDGGGTEAERRAMDAALANADTSVPLRFADEPRLAQALEACRVARGDALTVADVHAARAIAAVYSA